MNESLLFVLIATLLLGFCLAFLLFRRKLNRLRNAFLHDMQNLRYELNTKTQSIEKKIYHQQPGNETIIYDSRNSIRANDFTGNGARTWDYVAHRFSEESGTGSHQIENNSITIGRTNAAGRYELYLKNYVFNGERRENIPAITTYPVRHLRICCEVKKGAASHLLRFVFKGEETKEVLDEKDYVAFNPDWEKAELFFAISTAEACLLRIDDLSVLEAPSNVCLRNIVLFEKVLS